MLGTIAMAFKYQFLTLLFFIPALFGAESESYIPLHITSVLKDCNERVVICNAEYCADITMHSQTPITFEKPFQIPFISIVDHMKEYAQAARGELFIAQGSLNVKIGNNEFGIWENEMGIMCSSYSANRTFTKLMKNINKKNHVEGSTIAKALCYLLSINKKGEMVLGNATTDYI